ncbi:MULTISPECIES: AAA family ATPase [Vibrio harveyi group]|uniref:Chromosome segregation protein SMC n=1 Tax=Vibrio owensii CAIM 1854 = LMG 25443 TaxID=1229493 RepID=A0A0C1ZCN3_9VIBR|nr:AAA family ATPase [Vibrio owensii]KIF53809.1 chromosome segregation protein SMC [Vibrio owensii CAIM 1854 = LMG 25443]
MIEKITIHNFKLFSDETFTLNPQFNLIVGVNGSGKSSLLKALAVSLAGWAHAYIKSESNLRPIERSEIREIQRQGRFDLSKETSIEVYGEFPIVDRNLESKRGYVQWKRFRQEGDTKTYLSGNIRYLNTWSGEYYPTEYNLILSNLGHDVLKYIESGEQFDLPLIAFYECDRLWISKNQANIESAARKQHSRFDPYLDCFHTGTDSNAIEEWLLKLELSELQKKNVNPVKKAIEIAAMSALEDCIGFRFDLEESRVMVEFKENLTIPFEHLSDGQRTILSLFCDIARRAAILNPHLDGEAIKMVEGVVLIDEIDLHLHPKWQRKIVESLRNTFPNIQFVCTTHSPFIIQSIRSSEEIIMMTGEPLLNYANKSVEEISKNMGVERPDVSIKYEEMKEIAKSFMEELEELDCTDREKQEEFKKRLASAVAPYADNPAYQAFLELQMLSKFGEK